MVVDADVANIAHGTNLAYPLLSMRDLVRSMVTVSTVQFRGTTYDAATGAELLPDFFFPISCPEDFTAKVADLLVARGLLTCTSEHDHALGQPRILAEEPTTHLSNVLARLEVALRSPVTDGLVPPDRVDALDIVAHGLEFSVHPEGLRLWREALWGQRLDPDARAAVVAMAQFVTDAAERGEWSALTKICDCLEELVEPGLRIQVHVGGTARSSSVSSRATRDHDVALS